MSTDSETARPYRSPLRAMRAAETRRQVYGAAAVAFARDGYEGARLEDIAALAGVSVETVKGLGPKHALLLAAFEQAMVGDVGEHPLEERMAELPPEAATADGLLDGFVDWIVDANERTSRLWQAFVGAARSHAPVAAAHEELLRRRDADVEGLLAEFAARGWQPHLPPRDAAQVVGYLVLPDSHAALVLRGGMTRERYRTWLADALRHVLGGDA